MCRCTYLWPTRSKYSRLFEDLLPIIHQVGHQLCHLVKCNLLQRDKSFKQQFWNDFCRKNPTEFQTLKLNDLNALEKSNYNPNTNVKIYFQGWGLTGTTGISTKDGNCIEDTWDVSMFYNWLWNGLFLSDDFSTALLK